MDYYGPIIKIKQTLRKKEKSDFQNHIIIFKYPVFNQKKAQDIQRHRNVWPFKGTK